MNISNVYEMYKKEDIISLEEKRDEQGNIESIIIYPNTQTEDEVEIEFFSNGIVKSIKSITDPKWNGENVSTYIEYYDEYGNKIGTHYKDKLEEIKTGKNGNVIYYEKIVEDEYNITDYELYEKNEDESLIYSIEAHSGCSYANEKVIISRGTIFKTSFFDRETGERMLEEEFKEKYPEYDFSKFNKMYPEYQQLRKQKIDNILLNLINEDEMIDKLCVAMKSKALEKIQEETLE